MRWVPITPATRSRCQMAAVNPSCAANISSTERIKARLSSTLVVASTQGSHCRKYPRLRSTVENISSAWRSSTKRSSKPSRIVVENMLHRAVRVIPLVVVLIFARFHARDPGRVAAIPVDGRPQARLERHLGLPAGFPQQLFRREGIAPVVAGAVLDGLHQRPWLADGVEDTLYHFQIRQRAAAADVVNFAGAPAFDHR